MLQMKIKLGNEEVSKITTFDYAKVYFKISKKNKTLNYCALKNYPLLKPEIFYFMLVNQDNLVHFEEVNMKFI
jgi:hypothetical protein